MARRRVQQVNNIRIIFDTKNAMYYAETKSGDVLRSFYDLKPAVEYCRSDKMVAELKSNNEWGVDNLVASSISDAFKHAKTGSPVNSVVYQTQETKDARITTPKPGTYTRDINGLIKLFTDKLGRPDENSTTRLEQYYKEYETKGLPGYDWITEAICITASKTNVDQRTMGYVIGILKQWNEYGYGNNVNDEQRKVVLLLEQKIGVPLTYKAKSEMLRLFGTYGIVDVLATMFQNELRIDIDLSALYVQQLEQKINEAAEQV